MSVSIDAHSWSVVSVLSRTKPTPFYPSLSLAPAAWSNGTQAVHGPLQEANFCLITYCTRILLYMERSQTKSLATELGRPTRRISRRALGQRLIMRATISVALSLSAAQTLWRVAGRQCRLQGLTYLKMCISLLRRAQAATTWPSVTEAHSSALRAHQRAPAHPRRTARAAAELPALFFAPPPAHTEHSWYQLHSAPAGEASLTRHITAGCEAEVAQTTAS